MSVRFGCSWGTFPGGTSLDEKFSLPADMGFDGIEIGAFPQIVPAENLDAYRRLSEQHRMAVLGFSTIWTEEESFAAACRAVRSLGGEYVNHMYEPGHRDWPRVTEAIARFAELAQDCGLRYFLETHRDTVTEQIEDARQLAEALPWLQFNADLSHYVVLNRRPAEFAWIYPRVGHIHLRVASVHNVQPEVGAADAPWLPMWREIWGAILRTGFSGALVTQIIPGYVTRPAYDTVADTANLLRLAREIVAEARK